MQVHDGHPRPPVPSVHPPFHILNPHLYMEQVGDQHVGYGDVDDGVLSSFFTLTFIYGAEQDKMWSWLSGHFKPFFRIIERILTFCYKT